MNISDINKYKKFVENGEYNNPELEKLSDRYSEQFRESISHFDIIINSDRANTITKDGTVYKCIVDYGNLPKKSALSNIKLTFYREIVTKRADNIKAGDIVEFAHHSGTSKTYLVLKMIETRDNYDLSIMQDCNSVLKWVDKNGIVRSYPSLLFSNSSSNFGVKADKAMILPDGRRQVIVQNNEYTSEIKRDMRFIFGRNVFKVIDFDNISDEGIVNLNLKDDLYSSETDNADLGIADYYNNIHSYKIKILNGDNIELNTSDILQLNVEILNNDAAVTLPVTYTSSDEDILTVDDDGLITVLEEGSATVTVSLDNDETVTDSITITASSSPIEDYIINISGSDTCKVSQSQTYTATVYKTEIDNTKTVTWSLFGDDMNSTTLATITSQNGNSCVIKGNSNFQYGRIRLIASLVEDTAFKQEKSIEIKSLF